MTIPNKKEIAALSLSEACIQQERMNSRLAVADSRLRMAASVPSATQRARRERLLRKNKRYLEELSMALSEHIEELIIS